MKKKRRTAREVLEDIASFPLQHRDEESSHGVRYAAWRSQELAKDWLKLNPTE